MSSLLVNCQESNSAMSETDENNGCSLSACINAFFSSQCTLRFFMFYLSFAQVKRRTCSEIGRQQVIAVSLLIMIYYLT